MLYVLFFLWVTVFVGCFFRTEVFYIKTVYDLSISNAKAIRFHSHTKVVSNIRFLIYPFRREKKAVRCRNHAQKKTTFSSR